MSATDPIHGSGLELKAGENLVKEKKDFLVLWRERHGNPLEVKVSTFV